jgi:hypothetical protein
MKKPDFALIEKFANYLDHPGYCDFAGGSADVTACSRYLSSMMREQHSATPTYIARTLVMEQEDVRAVFDTDSLVSDYNWLVVNRPEVAEKIEALAVRNSIPAANVMRLFYENSNSNEKSRKCFMSIREMVKPCGHDLARALRQWAEEAKIFFR